MADSKKYNGSTWEHSLRKLTTATESVGNLIYSNGQPLLDWRITGNTVQNGTPTPSKPVAVNGVGDKTANLLPRPTAAASGEINGVTYSIDEYGVCTFSGTATADVDISYDLKSDFTIPISVSAGGHGVIAFNNSKDTSMTANFMYNQTQIDDWNMRSKNHTNSTYTLMGNKTINRIRFAAASGSKLDGLTVAIAFSDDDTAVSPFVPSGYKIPISNGQQTTNIYLGSTQTVRAIKKLVLTGNETWSKNSGSSNNYLYYIAYSNIIPLAVKKTDIICTHFIEQRYPPVDAIGVNTKNNYNQLYVNFGGILNSQPSGNTPAGVKQFLSAQYAAGTPVTFWYVLAEPTTGIVNEPLMKIGTYADTLSNAASIPTIQGANSITVDTTVQPSEFTATWTGWHNANVKEWDGQNWT